MVERTPVASFAEALRYIQVSGVFYCPSVLTEPWGIELPPMANCVWFHVVTDGRFTIDVDGTTLEASTGDLLLVPHGSGHRGWGFEPAPTRSVLDLPHEEYSEQYAVLRHGGGGRATHLVCGGVRLEHPSARQLIDALPPVIHIQAAQTTRADWTRITLELMAEETQTIRPGSEAVISRLCDIVVIQAIRTWIEQDPAAQTGWLGALRDPQIGSTIAEIHAHPERQWSVETLADHAAMSRSAFAARFTELVGEPCMRYVTRCRMQTATELLRSEPLTVAAAAARVGYDSEAAFSRAFKRIMGVTPRTAASDRVPETAA